MKKAINMKKMRYPTCALLALLPVCESLHAAGTEGLSGKAQTLGRVAGDPTLIGTLYNPAVGYVNSRHVEKGNGFRGEGNFGVHMENGSVDNLFDEFDDYSDALATDKLSKDGVRLTTQVDINSPQFQAIVDEISQQAAALNSGLKRLSDDGYARGTGELRFSMLLDRDIAGGTMAFDYVSKGSVAVTGVVEEVVFDPNAALTTLTDTYDLTAGSPAKTFALNGGALLTIDPSRQSASVAFDSDSTMLTRGVTLQEFVFSYSRPLFSTSQGVLTAGIAPKLIGAGLTTKATRIGEVQDAEKQFEDIEDDDFDYKLGVGVNAGLFWDGGFYHIGVSGQDLTETDFDFPDIDTSDYRSQDIIDTLQQSHRQKLERQFTVESGIKVQHLNLTAAMDTNAKKDMLGAEYQWASLSGSYQWDNFWLPSVRFGIHKNQVGSELSYVAAGVTVFKYVNIDMASTTKDVEQEGDDIPRGLDFSIGFNYAF